MFNSGSAAPGIMPGPEKAVKVYRINTRLASALGKSENRNV